MIASALLFLLFPIVGFAQSAQGRAIQDRAQGYLFFGMSVSSGDYAHFGIFHTGGGADFRVYKRLGIDTELEAMGRVADGQGLFSIGPSYHFLGAPHKSKLEPFVGGGYSRGFDGPPGAPNLFYFGGGINCWFFKRAALRVDCRDYLNHSARAGFTASYPAVRIGIVFR